MINNHRFAKLLKLKCTPFQRNKSYASYTDHDIERFNPMNVQMLNKVIYDQVFPFPKDNLKDEFIIQECINDLKRHNLWNDNIETVATPKFKLPDLRGKTVDEHFKSISREIREPYFKDLKTLAFKEIPKMPKQWTKKSGWTKYTNKNGKCIKETVDFPDEKAMVLDCEVLVKHGHEPVIAVAVSNTNWYSWTSSKVNKNSLRAKNGLNLFIPLETSPQENFVSSTKPRVIVGHNISYDRARVKEQFFLQESKIRFVDTLSMHIAISGFISSQKGIALSDKKTQEALQDDEVTEPNSHNWLRSGSLNNLSDVHKLYCGTSIDKSTRDIFVVGDIEDVRSDFQNLMKYCANDVLSTHNVLSKMFPMYLERFPHPVTFAAMLEMGCMYLPINKNWINYIKSSERLYDELHNELRHNLTLTANEACYKMLNEKWKDDKWLWDLDWSVRKIKLLKTPRKKYEPPSEWFQYKPHENILPYNISDNDLKLLGKSTKRDFKPSELLEKLLAETSSRLPKIESHMPGYPKWYSELCLRDTKPEWKPGPVELSPLRRIVPKLLNITWNGYPLHYIIGLGWGYLADDSYIQKNDLLDEENEVEDDEDSTNKIISPHGKLCEVSDIPNGMSFYKIPHKDGNDKNVGGLFSKGMSSYVDDGFISSADKEVAMRCLEINTSYSYWRSSRHRILSQVYMFQDTKTLPEDVIKHSDFHENLGFGSIIPLVAVSGTVTRRAVEPTWLTASNIKSARIGSELKSLIQAPPGYCFVGADVDSQELWIASVLGDTMSAVQHGCTPLSWMTLQGQRELGTDMHSKTAAAIGITRDQAKAFNYARIYGGGKKLALRMMENFNPSLSHKDASKKVETLYKLTKGDYKYSLSMEGRWFVKKLNLYKIKSNYVNSEQVKQILNAARKAYGHVHDVTWDKLVTKRKIYSGGMESEMFNKLTLVANSISPETPVLKCKISRALEPRNVEGKFVTSRMNWVVQSSAVDYLHLLLVCMKWLIKEYDINARFAISIHDELRYLCKEEDKYRTALALQISNLLTRCMFAHKLGIDDLPQSVSYFSSVEIDKVIRKDVNDDCKTLSNPDGLYQTYGIPPGESINMEDILRLTNNGSLT